MAKVTKKTTPKKAPIVQTMDSTNVLNEVLDRISALEKKQSILVKGLEWAGETLSKAFGLALAGQVLTEIANKIEKGK